MAGSIMDSGQDGKHNFCDFFFLLNTVYRETNVAVGHELCPRQRPAGPGWAGWAAPKHPAERASTLGAQAAELKAFETGELCSHGTPPIQICNNAFLKFFNEKLQPAISKLLIHLVCFQKCS